MTRCSARFIYCLALFGLCLSGGASAQTTIQPSVSGSLIRFESNGNVTLNGHCFGSVSSPPTDGALVFYNGQATAKNGNLYFRGPVHFNATNFPDNVIVREGATTLGSVGELGAFNLRGACFNTAGCSNTRWEPTKWNDGGGVQTYNNCYNYGNDKITGSFAQPGRAHGIYPAINVTGVRSAALADGLRWVGWDFPGNTYDCGDGHLVFMAIWPDPVWPDYHWWRLDQLNGLWSHKPGQTQATNRDSSNNLITNPLAANRGPYVNAGGFYCTCGGLAAIN
jgi:hypothetical protein